MLVIYILRNLNAVSAFTEHFEILLMEFLYFTISIKVFKFDIRTTLGRETWLSSREGFWFVKRFLYLCD